MKTSPLTVVIRLRGLAALVLRRVARLQLSQTAANLAFLSMLALVPVFTIAVSLLGATPMFAMLREALVRFLSANFFLPGFSETVVRYLNQFAAKASQLSWIGAIAFLAAAFTALLTLERTLNRIWDVDRPRPLARRLTLYWTFLTLGPLLMGATLVVNGLVVSELFGGLRLREAERVWLALLPWLASLAGLTLLYRLVPNTRVRWRDALIGALIATIALELLKRGLGLQLTRLPTYTIVYGAFAALPVLLIWVFMLWLIVLSAAVVAASLPAWGIGPEPAPRDSAARCFARSRQVIEALLAWRVRGEAAMPAGELRDLFAGDPALADDTGRRLAALGYLRRFWWLEPPASGQVAGMAGRHEATVWREWWLPAPGLESMTLRALFEHCWHLPLASGANQPAAALSARRTSSGADPVRLGDLDRPLAQLGPEPVGRPLAGAQTAGA